MYDGGEVVFYSVANSSSKGQMPTKTYTELATVCYEQRTVGVGRYSAALQFDTQISWLIRTPALYDVARTCVAVLKPYSHSDNAVYSIYQIQHTLDDKKLPCTDFSLVRLEGLDADVIINNS